MFQGAHNVEAEPLPEADLVALGRSMALQLYRGERMPQPFSRTEQHAVRFFRSVAGDDAPVGVPLTRRGA
jgi:hypothetical protein